VTGAPDTCPTRAPRSAWAGRAPAGKARRGRSVLAAAGASVVTLALAASCSPAGGAGDGLAAGEAWAAEADDLAAVYLTIDNDREADRLIGATSDVAGDVTLMDNGGTDPSSHGDHGGQDSRVDLAVPPGTTVLAPGGLHVMLGELAQPLRPGDRITLDLRFEHAGTRSVDVEILSWDDVVDRMPATTGESS
jgi:periplasmic copper chaperone A